MKCPCCNLNFRLLNGPPSIRVLVLPNKDELAIPWDVYWSNCKQQKIVISPKTPLRTVCLDCVIKAGIDCWRFQVGRETRASHTCGEDCEAAVARLQGMIEETKRLAKEKGARRSSAGARKEECKNNFIEKAAQWGAEMASFERRHDDGTALRAFLAGYFDKATQQKRNGKGPYTETHMRKLEYRQRFFQQLLSRVVRPNTAAEMVDDLTALVALPGAHHILADVLGVLAVVSHGREYTRRIRTAVAERIKKERYV